jgi:hypothetical protein
MKPMKTMLFALLACMIAQQLILCAAATDGSGVLNLIIKMENSPQANGKSAELESLVMNTTTNLTNEVDSRKYDATISVTGDIANQIYPLYVTMLGTKNNHELIMGGMSSGEGQASFEDQDARMRKSKRYVEDDYVCGGKQFKVAGYLPQMGSFNESGYKIMDDLGLLYLVDDSGLPESQGKNSPYPMTGFNFSVVPVSSGPEVRMWDAAAKEAGLNGTQWYDALTGKFDDASAKGEPMVAVFTNTVSGSGEYLDSYRKFVGYAADKGASFVTTKKLVESTTGT